MNETRGELLYEGKAKKIYDWPEDPALVEVEFKDSLTAFNAQKKGSFADKGAINCAITNLIYRYLGKKGITHHLVKPLGNRGQLCRRLEIVPLEVVIRNRLAGSTAKKFGWEEGKPLKAPLVEFYYKSDALGDPFVSDDQALLLECVNDLSELNELKKLGLAVNQALIHLFAEVGLELIDFKIEFGRAHGSKQFVLADEITPDCCRLWDKKTGEKMDKDRFRRDLGKVEESYQEVLARLQMRWEKDL